MNSEPKKKSSYFNFAHILIVANKIIKKVTGEFLLLMLINYFNPIRTCHFTTECNFISRPT